MKSSKRVDGFTLVEIMIVVSVIGILTGIAVPGYVKAREKAQSTACMEAQSKMDGAVDTYAIDTGKKTGDVVIDPSVLIGKLQYVKTWPRCPVDAGVTGPTPIKIPAVGSSSICPNSVVDHKRPS